MLSLSSHEAKVSHTGVNGRFREILVNNILLPWLPPNVKCGTGIVIDGNNFVKESGQEDIILYDETLCPQVLASPHTPEGVFLYNSVLARIEIKSTLTRDDIRKFICTSHEYSGFEVTIREGCDRKFTGAVNLLFAYDSDLQNKPDNEYVRLMEVFKELDVDPVSGIVSMICIPGRGFYKIGKKTDKCV